MTGLTKVRYLLAGGWNTIFGYSISLALYTLLQTKLHIISISLIANILAITMSFFVYKFFVFKTAGDYLREYLRCYLVYGASAIISIFFIWLLVNIFFVPFWVAQALVMILSFSLSFVAHQRFTFSHR